jgi:hypothetical protein
VAARKDGLDCAAMILHVEPVAYLKTISVQRNRLSVQRVCDRERDQLLGKLVRPVIVGAVRQRNRKPVGSGVSADQMVCGSLARGIG